ncbi:MAG: 2-keto-4-pentenoate hydratase [Novosphingobium sp.]
MGDATAIATVFVEARRSARALESYPGTAPQDLNAAYQIQDAAITIDGRPIAGWKVDRINAPLDGALGSNRLAGPIFADTVVDIADGQVPMMPVFSSGFAAAEAELLLHIAPHITGQCPVSDDQTRALIDDVRIGIEIASSPYGRINADGPTVTASDFGNNNGLVRGPPVADWSQIDLSEIVVSTCVDGVTVGEATAATMLDGPYGAVRFLIANLAARGIDISAGTWVSTGAITGVHPVVAGQEVTAVFGSHGSVCCQIASANQG